MWQALHDELEPAGLTVVTVALDTDVEAARPFHEAAAPTHPALADPALSLVDLFGITNVPFGVWIDEQGHIVRPAEPAFAPPDADTQEQARAADPIPAEHLEVFASIIDQAGDRSRYAAAVRDWVDKGEASPYVLSEGAVIEASRPRGRDQAVAAAEFELAQHLYRQGHRDAAAPHFEAVLRLDPENWSYVRQALSLADETPGNPSNTMILEMVRELGAESFYPDLEM